jgi:hypothetical protein
MIAGMQFAVWLVVLILAGGATELFALAWAAHVQQRRLPR